MCSSATVRIWPPRLRRSRRKGGPVIRFLRRTGKANEIVSDQLLAGSVTSSCWTRTMDDQEAMDAFVESPWCRAVLARLEAPGAYEAFESQAAHVGNCSHPIRLKGHVVATDTASGQRVV